MQECSQQPWAALQKPAAIRQQVLSCHTCAAALSRMLSCCAGGLSAASESLAGVHSAGAAGAACGAQEEQQPGRLEQRGLRQVRSLLKRAQPWGLLPWSWHENLHALLACPERHTEAAMHCLLRWDTICVCGHTGLSMLRIAQCERCGVLSAGQTCKGARPRRQALLRTASGWCSK